jgi:hypothetical protein
MHVCRMCRVNTRDTLLELRNGEDKLEGIGKGHNTYLV